MKISIRILLVTTVFFMLMVNQSCQKYPPGNQLSCTLFKEVYYENGQPDDSAVFTFNENLVTKMEFPHGYLSFEYASGKLTKRSYFVTGATLANFYSTYFYNTDGSLQRIELYLPGNGSYFKMSYYEIIYSSDKITQLKYYEKTGPADYEMYGQYNYSYTGNNVSSLSLNEQNVTKTVTFQYDANPNYLVRSNPMHFFTSLFTFETEPYMLPFLVSANNIKEMKENGSNTLPVTYERDSNGNLIKMKMGDDPYISIQYKCN